CKTGWVRFHKTAWANPNAAGTSTRGHGARRSRQATALPWWRPHFRGVGPATTAASPLLPAGAGRLAAETLQHRLRAGIGLLQVDAPVFQLLERDCDAGDGAAHEGARPHHAKVAIEIFELGFAGHRRGAIGSIEHVS